MSSAVTVHTPTALTPEEIRENIAEAYRDPVFFCKFFFPHLFAKDIPWFHRGILSILNRKTAFLWAYGEVWKIMKYFVQIDENEEPKHQIFHVIDLPSGRELTWEEVKLAEKRKDVEGLEIHLHLGKYTLVMVPRGYSKTTFAGVVQPIHDIVYQEAEFFGYVSETGTHAEMQVNNIRYELEGNDALRAHFGNLVPDRFDREKWNERFIETTNGCAMVARGRGAQVRGLLHKGQRPQRFIVDDLEDKESVQTQAQRNKVREWFFGDLLPALPKMDPDASITVLATMLDKDCLVAHLEVDPQWTAIKFGAKLDTGEMLWPEMYSEDELETLKQSYAVKGLLHVFYLEYMNEARAAETRIFRRGMWTYGPIGRSHLMGVAIYNDPAISEKETADAAVTQVWGMEKTGMLHFLDEWRGRGLRDMVRYIIDHYFLLAKRWKPQRHGFEGQAFQAALSHIMREEMHRQNYYFEPIKITNATRKVSRIQGIVAPRAASGYINLARPFPETEAEFYDFDPNKKEQHDDGPDCAAGCIALLDDFAGAAKKMRPISIAEEMKLFPSLEEELGLKFGEDWRLH